VPDAATFELTIDQSLPAEAQKIIYREFIRIFLTPGVRTCLCAAHSILHPELHCLAQVDRLRSCVLCGAGLKETEGLSAL
jgi:hypothetical protein